MRLPKNARYTLCHDDVRRKKSSFSTTNSIGAKSPVFAVFATFRHRGLSLSLSHTQPHTLLLPHRWMISRQLFQHTQTTDLSIFLAMMMID